MKTINKIIDKVDGRHGAPMGRLNIGVRPVDGTRIYDCKVPLSSDGGAYDRGGAYWGLGTQLRVSYTKDLSYVHFYRLKSRRVDYDIEDGPYFVKYQSQKVADIPEQCDNIEEIEVLISEISNFILKSSVGPDVISIKNDNDDLGIVVDIFDSTGNILVATECFWFEDFFTTEK